MVTLDPIDGLSGEASFLRDLSNSSSFTRFFENAFQPIAENGKAKGDPLAPQACAGIVADVT